jgi:NTE family protein
MTEKFQTGGFSLVLSGVGALGMAHLGVLHDLGQRALVPGEIVGTR